MIKDIVVNLSVGEGGGLAGGYAVSVASALEAHIAGIAFVYDPIVPVSELGYIPGEVLVIDALRRDNEAAAKASDQPIFQGDFASRRLGRATDAQRELCPRRRPVRPNHAAL